MTAAGHTRWGQLTYTSFDTGSGIGGWQIKEVAGDLTEAEREFLRSKVATAFDAAVSLPQFPSPADIAALPRRLAYELSGTAGGYWHTVPAGIDGSGRPGNVFAHMVWDRDIRATAEPVRPINLWRSADWLTPFGPREVRAAVLRSSRRPENGPVTLEAVLAFLTDPGYWARMGVFSALLDAVAAAMSGGRPIVLACADPDRAALWVASVSFFLSPGTSRKLSFSTMERATALQLAGQVQFTIASIPAIDLPTFLESPLAATSVIIDEDEVIALGMVGGDPHRTAAGSEIIPTDWSSMAEVVLVDPVAGQRALVQLDEIAARIGDVDLAPMWPLAIVIARRPDEFKDAMPAAARALRKFSPAGLRGQHQEFRAASELVQAELGSSTREVFGHLQPRIPGSFRSVMADLIEWVYLSRAMTDQDWLRQPGGVPLPEGYLPSRQPDEHLIEIAREGVSAAAIAINRVRRESSLNDEVLAAAVAGLRLLNFALEAGLLPVQDIWAADNLVAVVIPLLLDRTLGPEVVGAVGAIGHQLRREHLCTALESSELLGYAPLGAKVPATVLGWIYPEPRTPPEWRLHQRLAAVDADYAVQVLTGKLAVPRTQFSRWRLHAAMEIFADARQSDLVRSVQHSLADRQEIAWSAADLGALYREFPKFLDLSVTTWSVLSLPWSQDLKMLMNQVAQLYPPNQERDWGLELRSAVHEFFDAMEFRVLAGSQWWRPAIAGDHGVSPAHKNSLVLLARTERLLETHRGWAIPGELAASMVAAVVLSALFADRRENQPLSIARDNLLSWAQGQPGAAAAVQIVQECIDAKSPTLEQVCSVFLLTDPALPHRWEPSPLLKRVTALAVGAENRSLLDQVVRPKIESLSSDRRSRLEDELKRRTVNAVLVLQSGDRAALKAETEIERFVRDWVRRYAGGSGGLLGRILKRD